MKRKPKAMDLAYLGNILYIRNKTNEWMKKITPKEPDKTLNFAKNLEVERWIYTSKTKK